MHLSLRSYLLASAVIACCATCSRRDTAARYAGAAVATPPPLPCFRTDSGTVAFGKMTTSPADQDVSGVQFSFEVRAGRLLGYVRDASGEVPPRRPLQQLHFDAGTDTLSFVYVDSPTTRDSYRYHVSCDKLTGVARLFMTPTDTGVLVHDTLPRAAVITAP